ncbi:uncharacterized protein PGRI_012860 [Penicillium griseofulvum]|uniref:HTH CENPB-type domain-containing protein n=1 Tax=Penicillium patulum TaxID=5078 RepID=A0A135LEM1_PENPA|nr:uncharacterized protein PGRI_012860 [Penicillium griseofulvum]KXG47416.1 hypothetical protein PGRI_012860 [Penicillium griseofulvum]
MPRDLNSNGRVYKTSVAAHRLNGPQIARLEQEIVELERQIAVRIDQVQELAKMPPPPPRSENSAGVARVAPKTLNDVQENVLVQWIRQVKELFALPMGPLITTSATQILNRDGTDCTISKAWVDRFIKRLPDDLKPSKVRSVKKKHIDAEDQETLEQWYRRLEALIAGVSPENIYNFDDTIFQIGLGKKPRLVVTRRDSPLPPLNRTYCEWITTIECIAADGWAADPFAVIQGDHYFDEWLTYDGTAENAMFMMNPSGRVDEKAACEWIESFHRQTEDRADGQPRLLLFRGQPQYLSFNFLQFCEEHKIIPFSFPPNIGHLLQPFDGKPFEDYKRYWRSSLLCLMIDDVDEEKSVFFHNFPSIREKSFKSEVIKDAFADRGIVPFDPSKVGQPL